jgi:phosphoglycolate phosphatase-like HAD superfamily hydrolase
MMAASAAGGTGAAAVWGFYGRRAAQHADHVLEQPLDALRYLE